MDAQTFLNNFATIADAPGAAQRLRDLVLDFAVTGRLVSQDASDEPAAELLKRIESDQARLVAEGSARPNRAHSPREPEGPLPHGWCWTYMPRLGFINPRNVVDNDVVAGFVPMPLIPTDMREPCEFQERKWSEISKGYTHVADGDVAIAKITPCFQNGKSAVFSGLPSGVGAATTELHVLRPTPVGANPKFLHLVLRSPAFILGGVPEMTGTAGQQRLPRQYFTDTAIPLPPLAEQNRIVARVDELMGLCDELEARQQSRQRTVTQFRGSALHALTEAETPGDIRRAWGRVSSNWPALTVSPDSIRAIRKTVLRLAVQGRLVAQDPNEEPAESLLEQLSKRRRSPGIPLPPADRPDLPAGWSWASFGQATINRDSERIPLKRDDRASRRGDYDYYGASGVIDSIDDYIFDGDLLLVGEDGANLVLCSTPIAFIASGRFWVNNHAHVLDSVELAALQYLAIFINSIDLRPFLTGIAQPKLNQARMNRIPVPLPPLAEQRRIVERVGHILAVCEDLQCSLADREIRQVNFAATACRAAVA